MGHHRTVKHLPSPCPALLLLCRRGRPSPRPSPAAIHPALDPEAPPQIPHVRSFLRKEKAAREGRWAALEFFSPSVNVCCVLSPPTRPSPHPSSGARWFCESSIPISRHPPRINPEAAVAGRVFEIALRLVLAICFSAFGPRDTAFRDIFLLKT